MGSRFAVGRRATLLMAVALSMASVTLRADWPQFRGPDGMGHSESPNLPLTWTEEAGILWKTAIHGRAWSSPVVFGGQVWVTTATADGRELSLVSVDAETGAVQRDLRLFQVAQPQYAHPFNSYASPTPVIERGRIYATFGSAGTAAVETSSGQVLWTRRDLECNHYRGAGSSPILHQDLLIMHFDGSDRQYLVGLNKTTGQTVWTTQRSVDFRDVGPDGQPQAEGDYRKAFSTPHVATFNGRSILISLGSKAAYAYDPLTGNELWRIEEPSSHSASTRPVIGHGMIFYPSGLPGHVIAVRPDGQALASESSIAWRLTRGVPGRPSMLLVGDLIFMVNDRGIVTCVEAMTGQVVWTNRIPGEYSASPIHAGGRVYFFSEEGRSTVIEAGREFRVIGTSDVGDGFMASPAVEGDSLILRSRTHLYRIGNRRAEATTAVPAR